MTGDSDFAGCDVQSNGHRDFVSWLGAGGQGRALAADGRPGRPALDPERQRAASGGRRQLLAGHDAGTARRGGPDRALAPVRLGPLAAHEHIHDIDAMGSALPYCDIVVADKAMASHIRRTRLSEHLQTVALARCRNWASTSSGVGPPGHPPGRAGLAHAFVSKCEQEGAVSRSARECSERGTAGQRKCERGDSNSHGFAATGS